MRAINIDENELNELYIIKQLSIDKISKIYNCSGTAIRRNLNNYGMNRCTQDEYNQLSSIEADLVVGSMLGDGTMNYKNEKCSFSISHCENQKEYLQKKFEIMQNYCNSAKPSFRERRGVDESNRQDQYRFTTKTLSCFVPFHKMSASDLLYRINENSLAIWMMDDGSHKHPRGKHQNSSYELAMGWMTLEESEYAIQILKDKFNVKAKLKYNPNINKNSKVLMFNVYDSYTLSYIIKNSYFGEIIRETMNYKLIHRVNLNKIVRPEKFTVPIEVG